MLVKCGTTFSMTRKMTTNHTKTRKKGIKKQKQNRFKQSSLLVKFLWKYIIFFRLFVFFRLSLVRVAAVVVVVVGVVVLIFKVVLFVASVLFSGFCCLLPCDVHAGMAQRVASPPTHKSLSSPFIFRSSFSLSLSLSL